MRLIPILVIAIALTGGLSAQSTGGVILPAPGPIGVSIPDLQKYLSLTDAQVSSLQNIQQQQQQAVSQIYTQMSQKQQTLQTLLESVNPDPRTVGQTMIDIQNLQKQAANQSSEPYHTQSLAVLTPTQVTQLATLNTALQLQTPAWQAVTVNLIVAPKTTSIAISGFLPPGVPMKFAIAPTVN